MTQTANRPTTLRAPGEAGSLVSVKERYGNFIGGEFVAPVEGKYRVNRRVWTNCYHQYPAGAAFGGYKTSGIGRENHRMMLSHYTQTKCLLVSYDDHALGLF